MLQQILKDMYIDPDVLEALNEEQKQTLFLKMRQEQVRRWTEREEKLEREGSAALKSKQTKASKKRVSWLLGRDGDVHVRVIGETDEVRSAKLIYSELSQTKGSGLQGDSRNQSNATKSSLVTRACPEPETVPSQTPPGIQLQFKGVQPASDLTQHPPHSQNSADLKSGTHSPPLQDPEEEDDDDEDDSVSLSALLYRSHLRRDNTASISDRLRSQRADPPSSADRLRLQEALQPSKGKDIQPVAARQREETEGAGPNWAGSAEGEDHGLARGRVAQLTKAFGTPVPKHLTLSRPKPKPPLPKKPAHLLFASPAPR
ncbi:SH2 domain-containing protein 4A-like isoform X2 [Anguilla anguilla]|uniref:SH2 domain-containing protein 4A-like isoform X2 n=1 Tax=Anguilla anguilla TaxID=7936 RepID=UPI0015AF0181|nr:SH2 domain-containing protein 4A-like isoform X2 [Anguilla anguilla]